MTQNAYVFLGPTLAIDRARQWLDATYLPPVQQGDVLRLLHRSPRVIAIIDGFFEVVPAVWHKEILAAMAAGVHVFGASSMGALRAAELHAFGMVGVGRIFEWYRDGALVADDEVAVIHGPSEFGYLAMSEALVDIRDASAAAVEAGVLSADQAGAMVATAKALPYPDRSNRSIARGVLGEEDGSRWLAFAAGRKRLKQRDAEQLLQQVASFMQSQPAPNRVDYRMEQTVFFDQLRNEVALGLAAGIQGPPPGDHTRLRTGDTICDLRRSQLLRLLVRQRGAELGWQLSSDEVQDRIDRFRSDHGLGTHESLQRWMTDESVSEDMLWSYINDLCLSERFDRLFSQEIDGGICDELRLATASLRAASTTHFQQD